MVARKVSIEMIQTINKLYISGQTMSQLSKTLKLSPCTISKYVWKSRPKGNSSPTALKVTTDIIQKINKIYNLGYDMNMVAKKVVFSKSTVSNYIWEPRPSGTRFELLER
mgnify:CR=1 FL=1